MIDNKKIPTWLGTAIIIIFATTAAAFVLMYEKNKNDVQIRNVVAIQPKKIKTIQDQPRQEQQNNIEQDIQTPVAGISNVELYTVDDFLKQNGSISDEDANTIKELTGYNKMLKYNSEKNIRIEIVRDNSDKNIIYFTDERFYIDHSLIEPDIYKLNLKTSELTNIYKATNNLYDIVLIGIKNNSLLFFKKGINDSPGPCLNQWVDAYEHPLPRSGKWLNSYNGGFYQDDLRTVQSIDINNTNTGFSNFTIPKAKYLSELASQKKCRDKIYKSNND
ncbi:MAG: hypothetical protein WC823_07265 [Parcubacteria group bacterium]|jgi:hypothetical protein